MNRLAVTIITAAAVSLLATSVAFAKRIDVEAGPIWNNHHAQKTCPRVARDWERFHPEDRAEWTGEWRTTVHGRMSVCELDVRKSRRHHVAPPPPPRHDGRHPHRR